jgi:hypothetical protein
MEKGSPDCWLYMTIHNWQMPNVYTSVNGTGTSIFPVDSFNVCCSFPMQLPDEAIISEVLEAPVVQDWFTGAAVAGDPDALFLALKLQERTNIQKEIFGSLLPHPFSSDTFFTKEHLQSIAACFKVFLCEDLRGMF